MAKRKLAIIGNGMAGAKLLEDLLRRGATHRYQIHVFGEEAGPAYNRMLLSRVLAGEDPDTIRFEPDTSRHVDEVTFHRGARVTQIDTAARHLLTSDKNTHPYDTAILATGSKSFVPNIKGATGPEHSLKPGVFAYRSLDDCLQMRSTARAGGNAVVLGGGLLGLEAAKVLSDTGLHVTVIHLMPHLMETQLDKPAGDMLLKQIERCGIFVRTGRTIAEILGSSAAEAVRLDDGTHLPADMVVLACGIRPRTDVATASGIPAARAILVNDTLATQIPGVYAIGECAEHRGRIYGTVAPIFEQCAVLADVLTGADPKARYRGSKLYTRLKVAGVDVASMGQLDPTLPDDEVIQVVEDRKLTYRKLIIRQDRLIGAMFVGDTSGAAACAQAFDRDELLPDNRIELLCALSSSAAAGAGDREICNCKKVKLSVLQEALAGGACTPEALSHCTGAGTGCGSCRSELARLCNAAGATPNPMPMIAPAA